jgi:L-iditol 2-dehydrogenase
MFGAFLNKPNEILINDVEKPEPKFGEIRMKLSEVGICGSDVHLF